MEEQESRSGHQDEWNQQKAWSVLERLSALHKLLRGGTASRLAVWWDKCELLLFVICRKTALPRCMSTQDYVLPMRSDLKYNGSELCAWLQRVIWFISLITLATHRKRPMESVWRFLMIAGLRNVKPKESISSKLTSWVVFSWFNPLLGCSVGRAPCCSRRGSPDDVRDSRPQGLDWSQRPHNDKHSDGPMTSQYLNYNLKSLKGSTVEGKRHRRQIKLKQVDILLTTFRLDLRGSSTKNSSTKNNYSPTCRY